MIIPDLNYYLSKKKNFADKFSGIDSIDYCTNAEWFNQYPVQQFDYKYNSWGFRGEEYRDYLGKPVNLCLGDSFTVNLGGPIEHSWPNLLQEKFDIPCINLGLDGGGNDAIRLVYATACKIFDVSNVFVLYSFFHRRLEDKTLKSDVHEHQDNIAYFKNNFIPDAYFQFIPNWCFNTEEIAFIQTLKEPYLEEDEQFWHEGIDRRLVLRSEYNKLAGSSWPSYDEFILGAEPHSDVLSNELRLILNFGLFNSRDGYHMSLLANQKLANNLYAQFEKNENF